MNTILHDFTIHDSFHIHLTYEKLTSKDSSICEYFQKNDLANSIMNRKICIDLITVMIYFMEYYCNYHCFNKTTENNQGMLIKKHNYLVRKIEKTHYLACNTMSINLKKFTGENRQSVEITYWTTTSNNQIAVDSIYFLVLGV